jgi:16S rRNA A1518/A1519 N6-dimethyltransferase RsmA/KsgA/DIM1 with predicted DNA glycosylase/AP lyase activity
VVEQIVARVHGVASVLEIGPGPGVLTREMSESVGQVVAIELDPVAVSALAESAPKATIHHRDVLREDLREYLDAMPLPRATCRTTSPARS